jgi:MoxR-like ATPase
VDPREVELFGEILEDLKETRPDLLGALRKILEYETTKCEKEKCDWTILDVIVPPSKLKGLIEKGIVEKAGDHRYKLKNREAIYEAMRRLDLLPRPKKKGPAFNITPDVFGDVVGYETVKRTLVMALRARGPVHVLLVGPPGVGKSLFLDSLREFLEKTNECTAHVEGGKSLATSAGLVEVLLQLPPDTPCVLTIDELDKMNRQDMAVLYRLMTVGEVVVAKHRMYVREKRNVWVIAACNEEKKIPEQILSRFLIVRFRALTEEEYKAIIPKILEKREGVEPELAEYIAEKLAPITRDPREAIRIGRMAWTKEDVDYLVGLLKKRRVKV